MVKVRIKPTKELFYNDESAFGIYAATVHEEDLTDEIKLNQYHNISIKGNMPKLSLGQEYEASIVEEKGSKFEGSYNAISVRQKKPTTIEEQKDFFSMVLTPTQVKNIFDVYEGQDVIGLIQNGAFDYSKVRGLGAYTYEKMKEKVLTSLDMAELLIFLAKHGIKYAMVAKLVQKYQNPQLVIKKIQDNPYVLTEVKGIGFKSADSIAKEMGYDMKSPLRMDSAIRYAIQEENMNGHSWIGKKQLLNKALDLLSLSRSLIDEHLDGSIKDVIKVEDDRYAMESVYLQELLVASSLTKYSLNSTPFIKKEEVDSFLDEYCKKNNVELEENQHQFFHDWNENNITVLVGSGGMGKSWLMNILIQMIQHHKKGFSISLLSPTGKASKVLSGYTGKEASTIHRSVGAGKDDGGFAKKKEIRSDVLIIDESSMCDISIVSKLVEAIANPNVRIMFVGDDFQLPSVGVGNFLYDMINSGCFKISRLKKVFRQADGGILDISTKVRNGQRFMNNDAEGRIVFGKDCVFFMADSEFIEQGLMKNYTNVLKKFNQEDIAILTPTNKGLLGTIELNKKIQEIANPPAEHKKEKAVGKKESPTIFRVGDLVMNTVNTYDIQTVDGGTADVFNGDSGIIKDIDFEEKHFIIDFEGIVVRQEFGTILSSIMHSWVTTIHKSQGSQYKVIIVIIDNSATYQLNANLMYTGFSRAKEFMLVLGQAKAVNTGITKFINMERRSFLIEMLRDCKNGQSPDKDVQTDVATDIPIETDKPIEDNTQSIADDLSEDVSLLMQSDSGITEESMYY